MPSHAQVSSIPRNGNVLPDASDFIKTRARMQGYLLKEADFSEAVSAAGNIGMFLQFAVPIIAGVTAGHLHSRLTSPEPTVSQNMYKRLVLAELLKQNSALERKRTGALQQALDKIKMSVKKSPTGEIASKGVRTDEPLDTLNSAASRREIHIA